MTVARIRGNDSGVMVKAHDSDKMIFLEAHYWPPHPEIRDEFALQLRGRDFVEIDIRQAGETAVIKEGLEWQPVSHYELLEKCQTAASRVRFGKVEFDPKYLKWILQRTPKDLAVIPDGIFRATIHGLWGDYRVYVRGHEVHEPPSLAELVEEALENATRR
jgi:hypothetical protein